MIVYDKYSFNTQREIDPNGFLRVEMSNITKSQVRPYLGREIPDYEKFNLDPNKVYNVLCPKEELEKAAKTFNNLPLTREHIEVDVDDVPKEKIVGSLGDHAIVDGKYLKNNLIIYDKKDIDLVLSGKKKELSCGYRYTPIRESGEFDGQHYDFKMTDIIGNHVALVKQGRAGRDVMVADSSKGLLETIKEKIMSVFDNDLVGDEFKESEHPRAENGQFTSKGGSSGGSIEHNGAKIDIKKDGKYADIKIYAPEGKKFKNGDTFYTTEAEADKAEELAKKIIENEFGEAEKKDVFKSRFSKHTVRRDDPNYKAQLSAAKNDLKEAISAFEKNIGNQEEKFKWIEQQRLDMAKADLEDLEKFEKESSKGTINDAKLDEKGQEKVGVVMKEFKEGELKSGSGEKVTDPKQAIAIALSEADKVTKDAIPEKQDEPKKAGEESALQQGEKKMAEEVKEEVKTEEKVETPAKDKPVEDACSKDAEIKKEESKKEEVVEDEKEKDLKGKEKEAFAEGVDYGEKKEKEEPKKLDSEHESEGAKKADKEEKEEKKEEMAKDSALVMDADALRAEGREQAIADFKCREKARKSVRSIVGDVDIFAFDSAEDIYKFACKEAGMNCEEIANFKDAFAGLQAGKGKLAMDASPVSGSDVECFKDIRLA